MEIEKKGRIKKDEVWSGTIHVTGDVIVEEGVTLTIEPRTRILFANDRNDYPSPKKKGDRTPARSNVFIASGDGVRPWTYRDYVLFPRDLKWPIAPRE